jgi:hypothetical protein
MSIRLLLNMQHQQKSNWCWAAVASSIDQYLRPSGARTQCQVACAVLGRDSCCNDGDTDACNSTSTLETALDAVGHLSGEPLSGPVSFSSIITQTSPPFSMPIGVRVSNGPQGHFLLIVGFNDEGGHQWVRVADPLYGPASYEIEDFMNGYQGMSWTDSFPIK